MVPAAGAGPHGHRRANIGEHRALWRAALDAIADSRRVFVHRDYHAQNLMWLPEREGLARVGLIDFQDAVAGSRAYDLISLIEDARRDVSPELAEIATRALSGAMRAQGTPLDEDRFRAEMAVMAAQRNAKIVGIFARLYKRDGKPRYLAYLPRVWGYLERDLAHPALAELAAWYDRVDSHRRDAPCRNRNPRMIRRAMIMAAGLGTRMRPLTDDRPKPLVDGGRQDADRSCPRPAGGGRASTMVVVNLHYRAEMLRAHLARRRDIEIRYSDGRGGMLGTGGGVVKALPHFDGEPFFILNSDSIWVEGYGSAAARHDSGSGTETGWTGCCCWRR